jgi:formate dehydrogenase major subunit
MSTHSGVCNFCGTGCGHLLKVEAGAVRGVFASPGHPVSRGRLCVRGWHIHELLAAEDRIVTPLIRRQGRLEPASYEEAVAEAAERLSRYSGDEIGFLASPRASNEDNFLMARLARTVFRSPNIGLASDQGHAAAAEVLLEGAGLPAMLGALAEIGKADLILVAGADLARLNPIIASEIHLASRNGAEVINLSSRQTQISKPSRRTSG